MVLQGNINKILLAGRLGTDPELRYTPKGNAILSLSIATHHEVKNADGSFRRETHWHKATLWGKRAESCAKYLIKGSRVFVQGELHMKSWMDKDGNYRKSAEIFVSDIEFLGNTKDPEANASEARPPEEILHTETALSLS